MSKGSKDLSARCSLSTDKIGKCLALKFRARARHHMPIQVIIFLLKNYIGDMVIWAHPFDLHFGSDSIFGWPRLKLHVWRLDNYGKIDNGRMVVFYY